MKRWLPLVPVMIVLPVLVGAGCPSSSGELFTTEEKIALESGRMAGAALAEAAGITQTPTGGGHSAALVPLDMSFGTCPAVTTSVAQSGVSVSVNFGTTACAPDLFPSLTCTGRAAGIYNVGASTIALEFTAVGCNSKSLNGTAEVGFSLGQTGVSLDGTFDLQWISDGLITAIEGAGQFQYDHSVKETTIASFSGTFTTADGAYSAVCSALVVSYQNNANLIPSAGTIQITRQGTRTLLITFNADSPSTGMVQITIDGRQTVEVNILEL